MRVNYLIKRCGLTGGVKAMFQHVKLLRDRGHDANIFTMDPYGYSLFGVRPIKVVGLGCRDLPHADVAVATTPKDVLEASSLNEKGVAVCHLSQGVQAVDLEDRISGRAVPPRYANSPLRYSFKRLSYMNKKRKVDDIYKLKTYKIATSRNIQREIEKRYSQNCYLVPYGVNGEAFHPGGGPMGFERGPFNLISVAPYDVTFKGVPDVIEAVAILKAKGVDVKLTRVSYTPETEIEKKSGVVDRYLKDLSEDEMGELYREGHMLLAPSLEGEGFGLPALEAMNSGIPCVLTEVGSYMNFDETRDYACFVPVRSPVAIADGVERIMKDGVFREGIIRGGLRVAEKYSLENTGRVLEEVLAEILGKERALKEKRP